MNAERSTPLFVDRGCSSTVLHGLASMHPIVVDVGSDNWRRERRGEGLLIMGPRTVGGEGTLRILRDIRLDDPAMTIFVCIECHGAGRKTLFPFGRAAADLVQSVAGDVDLAAMRDLVLRRTQAPPPLRELTDIAQSAMTERARRPLLYVIRNAFRELTVPQIAEHFGWSIRLVEDIAARGGPPRVVDRFALPSARAVECADEQGRFPEMYRLLYAKQDSLGLKSWVSFALESGVPNVESFSQCVATSKASPRIARDTSLARLVGAQGTPTLVINAWHWKRPPTLLQLDSVVRASQKRQ